MKNSYWIAATNTVKVTEYNKIIVRIPKNIKLYSSVKVYHI